MKRKRIWSYISVYVILAVLVLAVSPPSSQATSLIRLNFDYGVTDLWEGTGYIQFDYAGFAFDTWYSPETLTGLEAYFITALFDEDIFGPTAISFGIEDMVVMHDLRINNHAPLYTVEWSEVDDPAITFWYAEGRNLFELSIWPDKNYVGYWIDPTGMDLPYGYLPEPTVWFDDPPPTGGAPVPEPATALLLAAGLSGLAALRKRFGPS
jgi:hypothetical protein